MTTLTYTERITAWRQMNPDKQLTFDLLLEICDTTDLWRADLSSANLADANLSSANLWGADLTGANLWGADLTGANLADADLTGAYLTGADLTDADLRHANLGRARWKGLQITGLPSGQAVLTPTPDGWELRVGCWTGTLGDLRTLIAQDEDWPEAEGEEIALRRPGLQAALALIDAHIAMHPNVISELKTKWGAK